LKPVILGIARTVLTPAEREMLLTHQPRGVILFGRNIVDPSQLADLIGEIRAVLPEGLLMVDQEGGRVARLRSPFWPDLPAAGTLRTAEAAYAHGLALGRMVKEAGFDIAAAPVLDLRVDGASDVIGDRAISDDPRVVAELGGKIAAGMMESGVIPVMKHLPGHGRALVDSHLALPRVRYDRHCERREAIHLSSVDGEDGLLRSARNDDLYPFMANNTLPWAMTAHIVYEDYDPDFPATLSAKVIINIIRGEIGFAGTLVSDDLAMQALTGTPAERAMAALAAGCDIALYCPGDTPGNLAILNAVPHGS
jgi:beta-N-acetylhexosaminidase